MAWGAARQSFLCTERKEKSVEKTAAFFLSKKKAAKKNDDGESLYIVKLSTALVDEL